MKKLFFVLLLLFCVVTISFADQYNKVEISSLPALSVDCGEGISAPFAGVCSNALVVVGGCNFPNVAAADGGKKVFYDKIFVLQDPFLENAQWKEVGVFPTRVAYGASVSTPKGIICIGGTDGNRSFSQVWLVDFSKNGVQTRELSALPIALDNMTAAYGGDVVYVAGGQSDGKESNRVFSIKLSDLLLGKEWSEVISFSGKARVQPTSVVQSNPDGDFCFYLFGGFAPATDQEKAFVHKDGLCYNPKTKVWTEIDEAYPLVGASACVSGNSHILFVGGVNKDIFENALNSPLQIKEAQRLENDSLINVLKKESENYLKHPEQWYQFNNKLLIYNTITKVWSEIATSEKLSRAGAVLVNCNNKFVVVNGETKPGVRSAEVSCIEFQSSSSFGWVNWTVLGLYLLGMLLLGFYFMKKEQGGNDFFKGGGRIPWWAAGISIYATMLSAITYMAYPAKAFATNWTYYPMLVTILLVSFPVIKYYLPFFRRLNVTSAYEYLELRFNTLTRLLASALFIVFMIARMALVLYLPSLALTAVTGIDIYLCIVLMGVVTIVYCTMGGVEAVVWGDVVQGFILLGGALFAALYLIFSTQGGWSGFAEIALADEKLRLVDWSFDFTKATFWVVILGGVANNLISYTSDQTVIQRYLTTKDERSASRSILMNGMMSVFVSVAFFAIGAGLYTFYKTHPMELDVTMTKTDTIFPFFMMSQLPAGVAGLLIAAIFAATMSTISSNINSVATAFSVDFYKRFWKKATDEKMLRTARWACIWSGIIGVVIALLMATWNIYSLLDFFQEILGLLSSGLGGLFLMGIFFPRINAHAALSGFVFGILTVFAVKYFTNLNLLLYGCIGMVVSVVVGYVVSLLQKNNKPTAGLTWKHLER